MPCYLSSSCFRGKTYSEVLNFCEKKKYFDIEFSAPHTFQKKNTLAKILKKYKKKGFNFTFHNYFPCPREDFVMNLASSNKSIIKKSINVIKNAIYLSKYANNKIIGLHPGYLLDSTVDKNGYFIFKGKRNKYSKSKNVSINVVKKLSSLSQKKNIHILVENLFPGKNANSSLFCSYNQIKNYLNEMPQEIGFLLDLGHLNISCKYYNLNKKKILNQIIQNYGKRIRQIHISENNGISDQHLVLKKNSWQFWAINQLSKFEKINNLNFFYCLEARNSNIKDIFKCINVINKIIKK